MEPFTAVGIASNIVQFVEFSWKLLAETRTIYKSSTGSGPGVAILGLVATDVHRLNDAIRLSPSSSPELRDLAHACNVIANEIIKSVGILKTKGKRTKWKCFLIALKEVRSNRSIESLTNQLLRLQSDIGSHAIPYTVSVGALEPHYSRN
jgi:hypothetical protein